MLSLLARHLRRPQQRALGRAACPGRHSSRSRHLDTSKLIKVKPSIVKYEIGFLTLEEVHQVRARSGARV